MMKVRYWFLILCLFGLNVNSLAERVREIAPPGKFYIDFENGNDANFGTKENRGNIIHGIWKLQEMAASIAGKHTYYLKQGVIYRGSLKAMGIRDEANPIQLTVDPLWGTGEAEIYGSERFTGD